MGEVYRALDTRLDRTVAIKVLPAHLSQDPEAKERFDREARAISSLSHPSICHLYDVGQQDGTSYLVMEYLEGETLADRLVKGPLPLDQVLKVGAEICDGLVKAHCKGVAHRDLKPSNIMLTKTGAKLMDFGLAKPAVAAIGAGSPSASLATMSKPLTVEGTILGTFQYMSPEQVEGKEADVRSDIFSLGAVLYEMITGKRAFEGKTTASTIAAILAAEPKPISAIQPMSPPALEHVVRACLEKDPDDRMQTAHDVKLQLRWIAEGRSEVLPVSVPATRSMTGRRAVILGLAMLLLGAVVASLATWNLKPEPPRPVSRMVITLPPGQRLAGLDQPAVALSQDGTHLAYVATQSGIQQLYLRAMDSLEARPIPGTEGATGPFFSPDGQWLGFFADQKLKKVSVSGGSAVTLADAPFPLGASWDSHGIITFAALTGSPIKQVPEAGGAPQTLTRMEKGEIAHRWPEFLPDGKAVLFSAAPTSVSWTNAHVDVQFGRHGRTAQPDPKGNAAPLRAHWPPALRARRKPDGCAIRSPAACGLRGGGARGGGRLAIYNQRSRPVQHFRNGIPGLYSRGRSGDPAQAGVGQPQWGRATLRRPGAPLRVPAPFPRWSAASRRPPGTGSSTLALRSVAGDVDPVYV